MRWQPAPGKVLNASYRYNRQNIDPTGVISQLKQVDFSGQWPLSNQWSAIGRWNYSLVDGKTLEGVAGFEYNGDCWAFRIVGQRLTTTTEQASKSIFVQFELNGLARLGTNPIDVLKRSVGYLTGNEPTMRPVGSTVNDYFRSLKARSCMFASSLIALALAGVCAQPTNAPPTVVASTASSLSSMTRP